MYLKGIGINLRKWVDAAQDRDFFRSFVNVALNLRVPLSMGLVNLIVSSGSSSGGSGSSSKMNNSVAHGCDVWG